VGIFFCTRLTMISASKISLFLGGKELYSNVSFQITKADKIGLTGKNGAGKSTMLKLIIGEFKTDEGELSVVKGSKVCYLPQEIMSSSTRPVLEEVQAANEEIVEIDRKLEEINHQLATREDYESESYMQLLTDINELNEEFVLKGGQGVGEQAEMILKGLGFSAAELYKPFNEFSGGWQMRVELAKLLVQNPDVLLLDEPTNHLDIESIQWLENYLKRFSGAILLISHDRMFLDAITTRTMEINAGKVYDYKLSYSKYLVKREEELVLQLAAFNNQQKEIENTEKLINKFRAKASKASFAQSLIKKLDKMDKIELDEVDSSALAFKFPEPIPSGKLVTEVKNVSKSFADKEIFNNVEFTIGRGEKIALIGKNGMGKSTFIKMLVGDTPYEGEMKLGHNVSIGYFAQDETTKLDGNKTVFETIDDVAVGEIRKKVRAILGSFLFKDDDVDKKVKVLSGGEKTRLALCKLLLEPYNFLILDEPTNHLDIVSKDVLKEALKKYTGTLLLVSHDRDFLDDLTDRIYYIKNFGISIYFEKVNHFLNTLNIQIQEAATPNKKIANKQQGGGNSYKEKKQAKNDLRKFKNRFSKVENEIETLEDEVKQLEEKVGNMDFSASEGADDIFNAIKVKRDRVDELIIEWEDLTEKIEDLSSVIK